MEDECGEEGERTEGACCVDKYYYIPHVLKSVALDSEIFRLEFERKDFVPAEWE